MGAPLENLLPMPALHLQWRCWAPSPKCARITMPTARPPSTTRLTWNSTPASYVYTSIAFYFNHQDEALQHLATFFLWQSREEWEQDEAAEPGRGADPPARYQEA